MNSIWNVHFAFAHKPRSSIIFVCHRYRPVQCLCFMSHNSQNSQKYTRVRQYQRIGYKNQKCVLKRILTCIACLGVRKKSLKMVSSWHWMAVTTSPILPMITSFFIVYFYCACIYLINRKTYANIPSNTPWVTLLWMWRSILENGNEYLCCIYRYTWLICALQRELLSDNALRACFEAI